VQVLIGIGVLVVVTVMGGPPEGTLLGGGTAEESEAKLKETAGFVATVGKVAMKSAGNAEFANKEHEGAQHGRLKIDSGPKHGETRQVK
jgi:hypothetical protein